MKASRSSKRILALTGLAVVGAACVAAAGGAAGSCAAYTTYVSPSLSLNLTAEQVAQTALRALAPRSPGACVESVRAVGRVADLHVYEPGIGRPGPDFPDVGVVWLVRAKGRFVANHGWPGSERMSANSGYFAVLDSSGSIVGMGLP